MLKKELTVGVRQALAQGRIFRMKLFGRRGQHHEDGGGAQGRRCDSGGAPARRYDAQNLKKDAVVAAGLDPYGDRKGLEALAKSGQSFFAMELVPRITRAQSMDVLSSQSNLAGYKAVLDATEYFNRAFPMMMTAAGTVPPAKVFVMGAGVAGLQAIATAKRLGADRLGDRCAPGREGTGQILGA